MGGSRSKMPGWLRRAMPAPGAAEGVGIRAIAGASRGHRGPQRQAVGLHLHADGVKIRVDTGSRCAKAMLREIVSR